MKKRMSGLLMALVMCLSLLPVSAQAAEAVACSTRFYWIERNYQLHAKNYSSTGEGLRPEGNLLALDKDTCILGICVDQSDETLTELSVSLVNTETETVYGPWAAEKDTNYKGSWYAFPGDILPAGTYRIVNSQPDTWRHAWDGKNNAAEIKGCPADFWIAHAADSLKGSGTAEDPYQISTPEELAKLANDIEVIESSDHYKLTADIDLGGYLWVPIGSESSSFRGLFDGNHHIVRNMKIQASRCPWVQHYGLFGSTYRKSNSEPSIQRLCVENAEILVDITGVESGPEHTELRFVDAGLLVGMMDGGNVVKDCMTSGKITVAKGMDVRGIGGVVGAQTNEDTSRIKNYVENCAFIGTIEDLSGLNALRGCSIGGITGHAAESEYQHNELLYCVLSVRGGYSAASVLSGTADFSGTGTYTNERETHYKGYYNSELSTPARPNSDIIGKTTAEMKTPAFAAELGGGWKQDSSLNGGYPYLAGFEAALGQSTASLLDGTMEITGSQSIGSTLTAEVTGCSESDLDFSWYRFGRAEVIDTGKTHVLTREDMGRTLYCRAVSKDGSCLGSIRGEVTLPMVDHGRQGYHMGALQESFEGGAMPENWSNSEGRWTVETKEGKNHHGSGHISCQSWGAYGVGNLYTPTFSVGLGDVLTFCAVGQDDARPFEHLIVYGKTAESTSWSTLADITTTSQWEEYSVEFPEEWAGKDVQLCFILDRKNHQGKINLDCVYHWVPDVRPLMPGPAAPTRLNLSATGCTNYLNNDGAIEYSYSSAAVEYRKAGDPSFKPLPMDGSYKLTGLTPGVYEFRYAETATHHAGAVKEVTVPEAYKHWVYFGGGSRDVTGEGPADIQLAAGAACTVPENTFTRPGYTFTHWRDETSRTDWNPGATFIMPNWNVYLDAQWTARTAVADPVIDPDGGTFQDSQTVTITCETEGAAIRYTLDGSDPTRGGTLYTGPFTLTNSAAVTAAASKDGMDDSDTVTAQFTLKPRPAPSGGGSYTPPTYPVELPETADHGKTEISPRYASRDDRVTVTLTPDPGYAPSGLTVTDRDGQAIPVTDLGGGKYGFIMPSCPVSIRADFRPVNPFTDVTEPDWFYEPVLWAVDQKVTAGISETLFGPHLGCTRAQIVTFLWNLAGKPQPAAAAAFADVAEDDWFCTAVSWAAEQGITSGVSETEFAPDLTCTRAQAMTFLWKYLGRPAGGGEMPFEDVSASDWFAAPVEWAVAERITAGTSEVTFGSDDPCTRAQIVTFLYRAMKP